MGILGLITARGGSKRLPKKSVLPVSGKPLIAWTIEAALQSKCLGRVIVSTDDEEIAEISRLWGAEIPFMRPAELARDDSSHISVVEHAVEWLSGQAANTLDSVMVLQPTSPLRTAADIDSAASIHEEKGARGVVSVCATHHHPYLVKRIAQDGTLEEFVSSALGYDRFQDLPPAYFVNGAIYLTKCEAILQEQTFYPYPTFPYVMPEWRSTQIDNQQDIRLVEMIRSERYDRAND